jgi:hypothetical protein
MRSACWLSFTLFWLGCSDLAVQPPSDGGPDADQVDPDAETGEDDAASSADGGVEDGGVEAAVGDGGLCTSCGACAENIRVSSASHRSEPIDYPDVPPVGGDHNGCWTTFGVHTKEVADEHWVHNLEHGAVVFLYNCPDGCSAEQAKLEALVQGRPFALVLPYAALRTRFAAVAWENRLLSDCYDEAALRAFYTAHVDNALESSSSAPPSSCL